MPQPYEAIEEYRSKNLEGVLLEFNFEKADHVDWDFLDRVVTKKGFDYKWIMWTWGVLEM